MPKIHALLVGIDSYRAPDVADLRGCVNDIALAERVLRDRFDAVTERLRNERPLLLQRLAEKPSRPVRGQRLAKAPLCAVSHCSKVCSSGFSSRTASMSRASLNSGTSA